jgi:hypothetical protein
MGGMLALGKSMIDLDIVAISSYMWASQNPMAGYNQLSIKANTMEWSTLSKLMCYLPAYNLFLNAYLSCLTAD